MTFVADLEPQPLWRHFDRILAIPRPSKGEDAMRRYVVGVAERHGLATRVDPAGNLVVAKPASPGREAAAVTILQGHLDMVQEKNSDVAHDWAADPIRPVQKGDYLTASGTTLGSDNGIGVAAMLAVAEADDLVHGPLELLFTIDEETGLTGAASLAPGLLAGRQLVNLDTEEEYAVYVGCAGGLGSRVTVPLAREAPAAGAAAFALEARGFKGGHSGVDIHLQRGNAIKLLARAIHAAAASLDDRTAAAGTAVDPQATAAAPPTAVNPQVTDAVAQAAAGGYPLRVAAFRGGSAHNAIPREASATVVVPADRAGDFRAAFEREAQAILDEVRPVDPGARIEAAESAPPAESWDAATSARVVRLLVALPHGVASWSHDIPDLVETSTNLATVAERDGALSLGLSNRSSVSTAIHARAREIRALAGLAGAAAAEEGGYPGWKPNLQSELLAVLKRVHARELGEEPAVKAIHAGLECGIIGEKVPGMDMISFGPQIEFPHSPGERVHVASVGRFWKLLTAVLAELA